MIDKEEKEGAMFRDVDADNSNTDDKKYIKKIKKFKRQWISEAFVKKKDEVLTARQKLKEIEEKIKDIYESEDSSSALVSKDKVFQIINSSGSKICKNSNELINIDNNYNEEIDSYLLLFRIIYNTCNIPTCRDFHKIYKDMSLKIQNNLISIIKIFDHEHSLNDIKYHIEEIIKLFGKFTAYVLEMKSIKEKMKSNRAFTFVLFSLMTLSLSELDYETSDEEKEEILSKYVNVTKYDACYNYKEYLFERDPDSQFSYCEKVWKIRDIKIDEYMHVSGKLKSYMITGPQKKQYIDELSKDYPKTIKKFSQSEKTNSLEDQPSLLSIMYQDIKSEEEEENKKTDIMEYAQPILFAASLIFTYVNRKTIGSVIETSGSNMYAAGLTACKTMARITVPVNEYGQSFVESIKNVNSCGQSSSTAVSNVLHVHQ